jgi:hypothetical protein
MGDETDSFNYRRQSLLPTIYNILSNILVSRLIQYVEEIIGNISVDFKIIDQLLIRYSVLFTY